MKKRTEKNIAVYILIFAFVVLFFGYVSFFAVATINNKKMREYKGVLSNGDPKFSLELEISQTWVNGENESYGQELLFSVKNDYDYDLSSWEADIKFNMEDYELVEIQKGWNTDYTFKDNTLHVSPQEGLDLVEISPKEANTFGFIFVSKIEITTSDFDNISYSILGQVHKSYTTYKSLWALIILTIIYAALLFTYVVVRFRERQFEKFKKQSYSIISQSMNTFGSLIDTKDPYTKDHSARVSYYSVKIARKLGLSDDEVRNIAYIALMHDCGKLVISDDILTKPEELTEGEYSVMKEHTTYGGKALENFTSIKGIKDGAMYHHERYDGTGYPSGLKGEEIPLCARIICVADALDAMSSDRCYRPKLKLGEIINELKENAGTQFDPKIANLVIEMINSKEIDLYDN